MQRIFLIAVVAIASIVSGIVCLFGSIIVLMGLGTQQYDNYEYYGKYPALYVIPGLVGLFLPPLLVLIVHKMKGRK